mmetsp:Transcript_8967/g.18062  ORF Transcript_8967/g.18062 Transcript_8967/m.18062 type:complete len:334 (-) Transcript_8967:1798-2799(-)
MLGLVVRHRLSGPLLSQVMKAMTIVCAGRAARQGILEQHADILHRLGQDANLRLFEHPREQIVPPAIGRLLDLMNGSNQWLGRIVVHVDEVASTQDLLREELRPFGPGVVVIAERQTQGRGRGGAEWESPQGSLVFSFSCSLRAISGPQVVFVQYLVGLILVQSLELPGLLRIKWPNDVLLCGRKVAGILCEGFSDASGFHLVVGVGINVANATPTVSLSSVRETLTNEDVLARFLLEFERAYEIFQERGFDPFRTDYKRLWIHSQQKITRRGDGAAFVVSDLSSNGSLLLLNEATKELLELIPDVTSIDLENGEFFPKKTTQSPRRNEYTDR